ncbi:putative golgin subfamily A member 6-like protein 3 isoform X1 [Carassius auratus]|uniref:Golgin subfamily A member 6-like protein 3 isoform X1 n=1 Tax=Carassius auratus TaxID=7957 RepID=A0A6P6MJQ2_CARAU|nr:putative golgin subfamily A member 6-like protein 3 isoform X1 [Carassius auratus]XP_052411001.1 U2 small nuclear ribonucleoprotein auxiliary factor 35 kDa subunit-related protein 1-like [Carassius gibelio]
MPSEYISICMRFTSAESKRKESAKKLEAFQSRMAHAKRFSQIPMSKCMRDLCKEEDYTFLNCLGKQDERLEDSTCLESEYQEKQEERIRHRQEREQLEREKQCEKEEQQKEKDKQWKSHVAELAVQRKAIHAKLDRLREFRDFQKKVVLQDLGLDPGSENESVKHLLMRL